MYRKRLINRAIRRHFVVTLPANEGAFSGVLVDYDDVFWRFEQCRTVPTQPGGTPDELPGRVWVKHAQSPAPYLQEIDPQI
jgi:hypothetical protein